MDITYVDIATKRLSEPKLFMEIAEDGPIVWSE
jgi:hypothetical protein